MNLPAKALNRFIVTQVADDGVAVRSTIPCYLWSTKHSSKIKYSTIKNIIITPVGTQSTKPTEKVGKMHICNLSILCNNFATCALF
jgi:hypothetical protein